MGLRARLTATGRATGSAGARVPDRGAVTLRRGRIYILPTGLGAAFGLMLFAMLLGSLNYAQ